MVVGGAIHPGDPGIGFEAPRWIGVNHAIAPLRKCALPRTQFGLKLSSARPLLGHAKRPAIAIAVHVADPNLWFMSILTTR